MDTFTVRSPHCDICSRREKKFMILRLTWSGEFSADRSVRENVKYCSFCFERLASAAGTRLSADGGWRKGGRRWRRGEKALLALMWRLGRPPPGDGIKTCLSWNPSHRGRPVTTRPRRTSSGGRDGGRARTLMARVMISFTRADTNAPTHPHTSLPPPPGPGPAGNTHTHTHTHTHFLPHTHTHTMVRPPIKSKVVCFYWSFALTSGLSFWRLYLSVSSWKSSVDNAQCFQLGENQTPGALAIFPPSPPGPPSLPLFLCTRSTILHNSPLSLSLSLSLPPLYLPPPSPPPFPLLTLFLLLSPSFSPGEGGLSPLQITDTKRRWWRRWRWELAVQGPVSINETMKVYFARMHVLNSFLCDSWLGNVSVNLIKDSASSHYFLSTPVPDGVKVHHLHPWLVQGAAPAPEQKPFPFLFLFFFMLFVCWEESSLYIHTPRKTRFFFFFTPCSKTTEMPKFIQRRHTFLQHISRYIFNTPAQLSK